MQKSSARELLTHELASVDGRTTAHRYSLLQYQKCTGARLHTVPQLHISALHPRFRDWQTAAPYWEAEKRG